MRHGLAFRKLGRDSAQRWHLLRNQVTALIKHERIETTVAKAKELKPLADKVVTLAKEGTIDAQRRAAAIVTEQSVLSKLFQQFPTRYENRQGGYTRLLLKGKRYGDNAPMAVIEYVDSPLGNILSPRKERLYRMQESETSSAESSTDASSSSN